VEGAESMLNGLGDEGWELATVAVEDLEEITSLRSQ